MSRARVLPLLAAAVLVIQIAEPVPALHAPAHAQQDQGLSDPGEEQAFSRALELLLQESQAQNVDTIFTMREQTAPRGGCNLTGTVYWAYATRGTICFTRAIAGEGWSFDVQTISGVDPLAPQDHTALSTLKEERAASDQSEGTGDDFRNLVADPAVTYPFPYERVVAEFDSPRAGDFIVMPNHLADKGTTQKGAHGHLGITQSRSTFLISGRGARRSPMTAVEEAELGIQHVDIAPTVAAALGVDPYFEKAGVPARTLNGEASTTALLERQDGEVLEEMLEPVFNTIVLVVDGLDPSDMASMTSLTGLIGDDCPGAGCTNATVYNQARATMVTETNANHVAMMTGAYGDQHGIIANSFWNRTAGEEQPMENPDLIQVETLFDAIEKPDGMPWLRTAAVMGKEKLRDLFGPGTTHQAPDYLVGATTSPSDPDRDCPAEPGSGSGYTSDICTMDVALDVLSKDDPDFTFINLPFVDAMSHVFGPDSPQATAAVAGADAQIQRLVTYLKGAGKWEHTSLIVTADHNFGSQLTALPINTINLSTVLGAGTDYHVVTHGGSASVYLDNPADSARAKALQDAADLHPEIDDALYRVPNPLDGGTANTIDAVHPNWHLGDTERIGDILLTTDDDHTFVASQPSANDVILGEHGHPSDRHVPFVVLSGGSYVRDLQVGTAGTLVPDTQGDDTGSFPGQAEAVDIAPTISWILGADTPLGSQGRILNGPGDAFVKRPAQAQADGEITEGIANRAAIFIFDQNNSVMVNCLIRQETCEGEQLPGGIHADTFVANLRSLADPDKGTLTHYGSVSSYPSVTFPNHNVIGSGAHPGHHDIVNNRFYIRETQVLEAPIDPMTLEHPLYHFSAGLLSQEVETLHEAVHRTYGNWAVGEGASSPNAFTASVNEPSVRGADYATLEPTDTEDGTAQDGNTHPSYPNPESYAPTANPTDLVQDTTQSCANDQGYLQGSALDSLGQTQARRLFDSNTQYNHPLPKYLINNFALTDEAGHHFGPHTACTFAAYHDADLRLGRIFDAMRGAGVFGETLIIVTGDHGGENVQEGRHGLPGEFSALLNAQSPPVEHVMADWQVYLRTVDIEASHTSFAIGQPTTVTFTVTDDDLNGDGSARPVEGAMVVADYGAGSLAGFTDATGQITFDLTPATDTLTVTVSHPDFNTRQRGFGPQGAIDQGTAAPPGLGGGVGGLCPGLENVLGLHIVGSAGADKLTGTAGREVMCGGGGNDSIDAKGGNDFVTGGAGDDLIAPGAGDDDAFGQDGNDTLDYSEATARITVDLGAGRTTGSGNDTIGGFQSVRGGRAADVLRGDAEANLLTGNKGRDRLTGLGGRDGLSGGTGKDRLQGGRGKDRLRGGPGRDTCKGGPGKDRETSCGRK